MRNPLKVTNLVFLLLLLAIAGGVRLYWKSVCVEGGCTFELRNALLEPIFWGSIGFSLVAATLLLFSTQIFKHWLIGIFSWFLPVSLFLVSDMDIHKSYIFGIQRGDMAWTFALILYFLTAIFIIADSLWQYWWTKHFTKRDLLRLLWLIPISGAIWYVYGINIF